MSNSPEKLPTNPPEKPAEEGIEIVRNIGRARTPEEIEKMRRTREETERLIKLGKKKEEGKLLSSEEVAMLRKTEKIKEGQGQERKTEKIEKVQVGEIGKEIKLTDKQKEEINKKLGEFKLTVENLESIDGFRDLSYGQILLVLENFKQLTLGRIQEEALKGYKKDITRSKFLGRIWKGITKQYQIAKKEKATAEKIMTGGMNTHQEVLEQLIKGTKDLELEVIINDDGSLEIQYVTGFEGLSSEEENKIRTFNKIATKYSKMPYEWSLETAFKKERKQFREVLNEYNNAKEEILNLIAQRSDEKKALDYVNKIDNNVRLNQFLNTHPNVEKELQNIKNQDAWKRVWKDIITERGIYFGAGFATRSATISLLGAIGLPIATAVIGGWITRERAKEELREREVMARRGEEWADEEAKNIVKADILSRKIELLIKKIRGTEDEKEKAKLLNSLKVRLKYTKDKLATGLVDFGKEANLRIKNQYNLAEALNLGDVFFAVHGDKAVSNELTKRLENFLELKKRKISKAEKKYLRDQMIKGAIFGAAAATAGYAIRYVIGELIPEKFSVETTTKKLSVGEPSLKTPISTTHETPLSIPPETPISTTHETPISMPQKDSIPMMTEGEILEKIKPEILTIGKKGPEGAIIDYFKANPEAAKSFGWDGKIDLSEWAGKKAHLLWLEDVKEALSKPETLEQLKKLGYSPDMEGYAQMMRHIGKGFVELDPETGKINLVDTEYLKTRISPSEFIPKSTTEATAISEKSLTKGMPIEKEILPKINPKQGITHIPYTDGDLFVKRVENHVSIIFNGEEIGKGFIRRDGTFYIASDPHNTIFETRAFNAARFNLIREGKGLPMISEILEEKPAVPHLEETAALEAETSSPERVTPEGGPKKVGPGIVNEGIPSGISKEDWQYLEGLVQDHRPYAERVEDLARQVQLGRITVEDIGNYYAQKIGAEKLSENMMNNLRRNFEIINSKDGSYLPKDVLAARRALIMLLQRLESIMKHSQ